MHHLTVLNSQLNKRFSYSESFGFKNKTIFLNQKYSLRHWDSFFDRQHQRQLILLGRPAINLDSWASYDNDPAFVTRSLNNDLNEMPFGDFCIKTNGSFSLLIVDFVNQTLSLIRDKFGVFPIFVSGEHSIDDIQISTHPDILAAHSGNCSLDKTSVAEFLADGYISHPYTFYKEIASINPGSFLTLDYRLRRVSQTQYFSCDSDLCYDFPSLVDELSDALSNSIKRRSHAQYGKTGVLLSGGGDSRPLALNVTTKPDAFTSFSAKNKEFQITRKITERLGIDHHVIKRTSASNWVGLTKSPAYTGGMSVGGSATLMDLLRDDSLLKMDNLLSGDYADWLLKDIAFNTAPVKIFGKKLPLNKFSDFSFHFYGGSVPIPTLQNKIADRRNSIFPLAKRQQSNALQFRRIVPLSNEYTSSTRLFLQRTLPWESYFIDNAVIDCVLRIPPDFKLNGRLYDQALKILCRPIIDIPHASKTTRLGTNQYLTAFWMTLVMLQKKLGRNNQTHQATWDRPIDIMYSDQSLHKLFYSANPSSQKYITDIVGLDIFSLTLDEIYRIDYHLFFNVISFCAWLNTTDIAI